MKSAIRGSLSRPPEDVPNTHLKETVFTVNTRNVSSVINFLFLFLVLRGICGLL